MLLYIWYESSFYHLNQADHEELAQQLGVTIAGPGQPDSPGREGEEGAAPQGAVPAIPDGKPCKW